MRLCTETTVRVQPRNVLTQPHPTTVYLVTVIEKTYNLAGGDHDGLSRRSTPLACAALSVAWLYALSFQCQNFLFGTVLVSVDLTCHQQQSTKCDKMFGICCFMHQQLESAKCVCYELTPTKTHPYRCLPVNFNLLLLQQIILTLSLLFC